MAYAGLGTRISGLRRILTVYRTQGEGLRTPLIRAHGKLGFMGALNRQWQNLAFTWRRMASSLHPMQHLPKRNFKESHGYSWRTGDRSLLYFALYYRSDELQALVALLRAFRAHAHMSAL